MTVVLESNLFTKPPIYLYLRGSPLSTIFGTWKKSYYAKFVLVEFDSTSTNFCQSPPLVRTQLVRIFTKVPHLYELICSTYILALNIQVGLTFLMQCKVSKKHKGK